MASKWISFTIYLMVCTIVIGNGDVMMPIIPQNPYIEVLHETCSWITIMSNTTDADLTPIIFNDTDHKIISSQHLVGRAKAEHSISVVKFKSDLGLFPTFTWVDDKVGATIMSYPVNYEILSLGTLKFEEITVRLEFNITDEYRRIFSKNDIMAVMSKHIIKNYTTEKDLICFRSTPNDSSSTSFGHLAYNYIYSAMQGTAHHSCFKIAEKQSCKAGLNNFVWNGPITVFGLLVMLFSPLAIGVLLQNPHQRPSDDITCTRTTKGETLLKTDNTKKSPRLALNSPLPLGARYAIFHWGNKHVYLLSLRVFCICMVIIVLIPIAQVKVLFDAKYTYLYLLSSYYLVHLVVTACQLLALLIITIHPASLSCFDDGSECGLDFDSNRYTCLYRQILNRFKLVTNRKVWQDRMFLIVDVFVAVCRIITCLFPVIYFIAAPVIYIFKFLFRVFHNSPQDRPFRIKFLPFYMVWIVIRSALLTIFVAGLSLQMMTIAIFIMQMIVLTTIGMVTDYGENEIVVIRVITILSFGWYILNGFKEYYNCYASVWRTIIDAAESWQAGCNAEAYNEINNDPNSQRENALKVRKSPELPKPLVVYTELIPSLPEELLNHVINRCKKKSVQVAKIVLWNAIVALFFIIAYSTIVSTHEYNEFTQVTKSTLTLAMAAFPKLVSMAFTTQEYASRKEAKQRRIWFEVFNYAEENGYNRIGDVQDSLVVVGDNGDDANGSDKLIGDNDVKKDEQGNEQEDGSDNI